MPLASLLRVRAVLPGEGETFTDEGLAHVAATHRHAGEGPAVAVLPISVHGHRSRPQQ